MTKGNNYKLLYGNKNLVRGVEHLTTNRLKGKNLYFVLFVHELLSRDFSFLRFVFVYSWLFYQRLASTRTFGNHLNYHSVICQFSQRLFSKMIWWNIALLHKWWKAGTCSMQTYQNLHSITGNFQKIWPQVQNSDIEKYILIAASEGNYFWRTSMSSCFSKAAAKICSTLGSLIQREGGGDAY